MCAEIGRQVGASDPAGLRHQGFFFLTDGPPLKEGAFGNHAIAANFIEIMTSEFKLVITRRLWRRIRRREVQEASSVPVFLYPDAALIGLRRISPGLSELVDILGVALSLFRIRQYAQKLHPGRLLVLVGGNGWFLVPVWMIAHSTGLPFDIYLVDDLEHSATLWRQGVLKRLVRPLERSVLRRAARIFCISKGYAEHLEAKYGVLAKWLPPPMAKTAIVHHPYVRSNPDIRRIVFVGSGITNLFLSALVECYAAIQTRNRRATDYRLTLLVVTLASPRSLVERLPDTADLETCRQPSGAELRRICSSSWATFLPYSFDSAVRTLVSTSFSWKLSDSFRAGRPILVYGPGYASIPRYFREAGLPLCATSYAELELILDSVAQNDTPELIAQYAETWRRYHSPEAVKARLTTDLVSDQPDKSY